jgi:hypothetical protein
MSSIEKRQAQSGRSSSAQTAGRPAEGFHHPRREPPRAGDGASCVPGPLVDNIVKLDRNDRRQMLGGVQHRVQTIGRRNMRVIPVATLLLVGLLLAGGSPASSQEARVLLTPEQTKAYHACLTAAWVQDYCRSHAWGIFGTYDRTNAECVAADRGDNYSMQGRRFLENTEGYCWNQAHMVPR